MSYKVKGILAGVAMSLIAVAAWMIFWFIGILAGLAGGGMGILFMIGYNKFDHSRPKSIIAFSIVLIIVEIILCELICIAMFVSGSGVSFAQALADPEVKSAMLYDIIIGLILSVVIHISYLASANRNKMRKQKVFTNVNGEPYSAASTAENADAQAAGNAGETQTPFDAVFGSQPEQAAQTAGQPAEQPDKSTLFDDKNP